MPASVHLGVDFGTSHTVGVLRFGDGSTAPLLFDGSPLLPSAVYAHGEDVLYTGRDAVHSARFDPARFEPHPKRRVDDGSLLLGDAEPTVPQVFAAVLWRVREECVRVVGSLPEVTLTHPAVWGPARRMVLQDAASAAGFGQPRFLSEPVAAATYFAQSREVPVGSGVVVYDFGGGTFDVSVLARTESGFETRAVDGSAELGGVDLDYLLMQHLGRQFAHTPEWTRLSAPDTPVDRRHRRNFTEDVRLAKERLSRQTQVELLVPILDKEAHLTRQELEAVTRSLLDKAVRITQAVIRSAQLPTEHTAGVFLVGGASRMPLVATLLHQATGIAPTVIDQPEMVVAQGATLPETILAPQTVAVTPVAALPVSPPAMSPARPPPIPSPASPPVSPSHPAPTSSPPVATAAWPTTDQPATTTPAPRPRRRTAALILLWIQAGFYSLAGVFGLYMSTSDPHAIGTPLAFVALVAGIATFSGAWQLSFSGSHRIALVTEFGLVAINLIAILMAWALGMAITAAVTAACLPAVFVILLLHQPKARPPK